jgi:hypothetical protein
VTVCRDRAPVIGSWPIRWTPSRRRLAVSPISRSAGRFVGRFPIPKSLVSVMVVSVRGAFPYCLIVVCLSSTCRLGVTPAVITLVREPSRCRASAAADRTGVEDETDLIGAADVEVVADDLLEEDPTRGRCVEHLGQGELGPPDRQVVAVASGPIGRGERMRGVGPATCAAAHRYPMAPTRSQIACTAAATGSSGSARARTVTGYAFGGARKIRADRMGGNARAGSRSRSVGRRPRRSRLAVRPHRGAARSHPNHRHVSRG